MNSETGEIRTFTNEEMIAEEKRLQALELKKIEVDSKENLNPMLPQNETKAPEKTDGRLFERNWIPLTKDQAEFFQAKGQATRMIWLKRLKKGLTPIQQTQLNRMVYEFIQEKNDGQGRS